MLQAICLAVCLCLTTALASAAPFVSSHGYTITPPPGWRVKPHSVADDVVINYTPKAASEGMPSLGVRVLPEEDDLTLEDFQPALVSEFKQKHPEFVIRSRNFSSLGGIRDLDWVFTQYKDNLPVRLHQCYVLKNGSLYIFTAVCMEKSYVKYDPILTRLLASVRWKP